MKNNQQQHQEPLVPSSLGQNKKEDSFIPRLAGRNNLAPEAGVAIIIIALLALIHSPVGMPMMAHLSVLGLLLVCFIAYAAFIMREEAQDERAVFHRMIAARASFFTGTTILTLGVFLDALKGEVNDWLIGTLVAMIVAKLAARLYADKNL